MARADAATREWTNAVPEPSHNDGRIALDDVVSFRCPPFLTADYDPTHRANIR